MAVQSLRNQDAEHLERWSEHCVGFHLFIVFEHYVSDLRKDGSGDELTLHVMVESLVRPILVVRDVASKHAFVVPPFVFIDKRVGVMGLSLHIRRREIDWGWVRGHHEWVMFSED